jgi:TonB family protein
MSSDLRVGVDYFSGAIPIQPEKWVTSSDHPESIIQRIDVGEVAIAFDIALNGRAVNCRVTSNSGNSRLDNVPCKLVMRRARFKPMLGTRVIQPGAHGQMRFRFDNDNLADIGLRYLSGYDLQ